MVVLLVCALLAGVLLAPLRLPAAKQYMAVAQAVTDDALHWSLLLAMAKVESDFDPNAVSQAGAVGLMQLMPSTAQWICDRRGMVYRIENLLDPAYSMDMAAWYMRYLYTKFSPAYALCAYNAGEGVVTEWQRQGIDPAKAPYAETRDYVVKVQHLQQWYARLLG